MRISDWSSDVCSSDLTLRIERVGLAAQDVGQWMAIDRQRLVLGQPAVDLLIANRQDLRRERADGLAERDAQIVGTLVEFLAAGLVVVLVEQLRRIDAQTVIAFGGIGLQIEATLETGATVGKLSRAAAQILELRLQLHGIGIDRKSTRLNSSH